MSGATITLVYRFGAFRLDVKDATLERDGVPQGLTPKAFSVLHHLVDHAGQLVTKDEFLDVIWPGVFVGDAALKVCIREIRKVLGDDPHTPTFIQTAHRRGYRFVAPVTTGDAASAPAAAAAAAAGVAPMSVDGGIVPPPTHYARSGDVSIAYQVLGQGPVDLVFVMGWVSHLDYFWREPSFARFLTRLASFSRLILFDKRGTGLSDRVAELPTLEQRMDDVRAVLEAVGSTRAALLGVSEGGPLCSLFATTHPTRTLALIMIGTSAKRLWAPDYPWAPTRAERERFFEEIRGHWGGPVGIDVRAPSKAHDPAFRDWWATYLRMGASPGAALLLTEMNSEIDVRHVLPAVRVPTLVLHRTGDACLKVEEGRYVAQLVPGAQFREFPGADHLPFVGDQDAMLDAIDAFLDRTYHEIADDRVLATVLCARVTRARGRRRRLHGGVRRPGPCDPLRGVARRVGHALPPADAGGAAHRRMRRRRPGARRSGGGHRARPRRHGRRRRGARVAHRQGPRGRIGAVVRGPRHPRDGRRRAALAHLRRARAGTSRRLTGRRASGQGAIVNAVVRIGVSSVNVPGAASAVYHV